MAADSAAAAATVTNHPAAIKAVFQLMLPSVDILTEGIASCRADVVMIGVWGQEKLNLL